MRSASFVFRRSFLMRRFRPVLRVLGLFAAVALGVSAARGAGAQNLYGLSGPVAPDSAPAKASAARGFDLSSLDPTCPACKDFAQFATGGWKTNNPIPADRTNWARFVKLSRDNQTVVQGIIEASASSTAAAGSNERKVGDYYGSCMKKDARTKAGLAPIAPILARNDSNATIVGLTQGGLALGDRDFYLLDDAKSQGIRDAYVQHVAAELALSGWDQARAHDAATKILALETSIAKFTRDRVAQRDPKLNYNKMDLAGIASA